MTKLLSCYLLIFNALASITVYSQELYDYNFFRNQSVIVSDTNEDDLRFAWGGGLNSCHLSNIDCNNDGIDDLVIFDKSGNRLLTYINDGIPDSISYSFEPYYQKFFPEVQSWVNFIDYDGDGKKDLFTYVPGGIKVYKNISDTSLKFQMLYPMINSDWGGGSVSNITVTNDDYPAFYDIDNDNDIDILTFFGLGTFLQMHRNMSQELYGNSDTLIYELYDFCWGNFSEGVDNNDISLNINCPRASDSLQFYKSTRHTGSTMLAADLNNDQLTDLILGDVDYFNLILLTNGGTTDSAHMVSMDTLFPSNTVPVLFNSFPVPSYIDINNDDKKDIVVSPFTSVFALAESHQSMWYYENTGSASSPVFSFNKPDVFQGEMIDFSTGSYPVIYDYNNDGLMDVIIGNYGYLDSSYYNFGYLYSEFRSQIAVLENIGTATIPQFKIATTDYANLAQLKLIGLVPSFHDLDNDGDIDMICGQSNGTLIYFENISGAGNLPAYDNPVYNFQAIDVGEFSTPQFFDLNNDNLIDLCVGKKSGYISYYQNTGTLNNPIFTKITDTLGKVNVVDPYVSYTGHSVPCFFRDSDIIKLFVASESGKIFYFKDIESNLTGKFTASDSILMQSDKDSTALIICDGMRSGVCVYDFNNDGYKDMIIGNFAGGLTYYSGIKSNIYNSIHKPYESPEIILNIFPNPAKDKLYLNIDDKNFKTIFLQIYNIIGNKVMEQEIPIKTQTEIDIRNLSNGYYLLKFYLTGNGQTRYENRAQKFVILK